MNSISNYSAPEEFYETNTPDQVEQSEIQTYFFKSVGEPSAGGVGKLNYFWSENWREIESTTLFGPPMDKTFGMPNASQQTKTSHSGPIFPFQTYLYQFFTV